MVVVLDNKVQQEEKEQVVHLILVQVLEDLVVAVVEAVELVQLFHLVVAVLLVVKESNYLGLYRHGDGDKIMMVDYQDKHQLLPIQQDLLVQEENCLGDMDGLQVVEVVDERHLVHLLLVKEELVVVMDQEMIRPMVDLLVLVVVDMVIGLLLVLEVVGEELEQLVLYHPQLVEEKVVLVL